MAKDTFDKTRDFVEEKIDRTKEFLGDSYQKTRERMGDFVGDARERLGDYGETLGDQFEEVSKATKKYIREYPGLSIAIAAGAGFLLGLLIGRRDD